LNGKNETIFYIEKAGTTIIVNFAVLNCQWGQSSKVVSVMVTQRKVDITGCAISAFLISKKGTNGKYPLSKRNCDVGHTPLADYYE
jgi:hypothetical protein